MRAVLCLLMAAVMLIPAPFAEAADLGQQQRIVVSPGSTDIALNPGETVTKSVTVVNKGEKSVNIAVSAVSYVVDGKGYIPRYTLAPGAADASTWISFEGTSTGIVVKAQEVYEVSYTVRIPSTAKPGGYAAVVFVTSSPESPEGAIVVHDRVSVPQYITVKGDVHTSGTATTEPIPGLLGGGKLQLPYAVTNTGGGHFIAKVTAIVKTPWGSTVYEQSDERYVLPGTERLITLEWQPETVFGMYKVEQSAEYLGTVQSLATRWIVVVHPEMLLGVGFIVLGVGWFVTTRRKKM